MNIAYALPSEVRCGECGGVMHTRHDVERKGQLVGYCLNLSCSERRKVYVIGIPQLQVVATQMKTKEQA